ncbi:MAG: NAD(P)H-binding protein [Chloroflexi bacterium]|nr:NAD(P)H-binding protein [Chloroflexota bacterium]
MAVVAVTGASGFVGRNLVSRLRADGHSVRCLLRFSSDASPLPSGIHLTRGDVRDLESVRAAIAGSEYVIHLAGGFSPLDDADSVIVGGTSNLVSAAHDAGARHVIHMSCLGADAAAPSAFYRGKWRAEMLVRASGLPFTILRPSLVVGRGDGFLQPLAQLVRALPAVPVPGRGQARLQPIDVEDLCRCVLAAMSGGAPADETVSVGGPVFLTYRQLTDLVAHELRVSKPKLLVPPAMAPQLGRLLRRPAGTLFLEPRLAQLLHGVVASPGIVSRTFGFEPRSVVPRIGWYLKDS